MDTNPMVQGTDTLTDCLNGTLITMNGNEVILQNDMGNRRVADAFLPSGYEPVGMKEYGGIIYIAAYNPITNKSQIGSFPSPQRKIDNDTEGEQQPVEFDFDSFFPEISESEENIGQFLVQDSFLIPLTKNNLHAGDKFSIWANGLSSLKNQISNYNNVYPNITSKAISPKNRRFTIKLGILNSQNQFVDITKTLCRWKDTGTKWEPVKYPYGEFSDIYKFNDGYFISDEFSNSELFDTIEDAKLIKHRQKLSTNTYAYKLIGPLYLSIKLNHIENFNYDIQGSFNKETNKAKLEITSYITYNCPDFDGESRYNEDGNENYFTFDECVPNFNVFDLRKETVKGDFINPEENGIKYQNSVYNPNTNTYTTKVIKYYNNIESNSPYQDKKEFYYFIGVSADNKKDNLYLEGLSESGVIDLNLLGSGTLHLKGWKFFNTVDQEEENSNTILNVYFDSYPEPHKSFKNLRFKFEEIISTEDSTPIIGNAFYFPNKTIETSTKIQIEDSNEIKEIIIPIFQGYSLYNGKQTFNINWNQIGLKKNKLYKVTIYYDVYDEIENTYERKVLNEEINRWLLTTELFNDCFNDYSISDFCDYKYTDNNSIFQDKLKFSLYIDDKLDSTDVKQNEIENIGSLISKDNYNIIYKTKHLYKFDITGKPQFKIQDVQLYPNILEISEAANSKLLFSKELDDINYKIKINGEEVIRGQENQKFIDQIYNNNNYEYSTERSVTLYDDNNPMLEIYGRLLEFKLPNIGFSHSNPTLINPKRLNISLSYYDLYKGYNENRVTNINVFDKVSKLASYIPNIEDENNSGYFGGLALNSIERSGSDDDHILYLYYNLNSPILFTGIPYYTSDMAMSDTLFEDNYLYRDKFVKLKTKSYDKDNWKNSFKFVDFSNDIYSYLNQHTKKDQVFVFCTQPTCSNSYMRHYRDGLLTYSDLGWSGVSKFAFGPGYVTKTSGQEATSFVRVWWRNRSGEWALINDLFRLDDGEAYSKLYAKYDWHIGDKTTEYTNEDYEDENYNTSTTFWWNRDYSNLNEKFEIFLNKIFKRNYIYCRYSDLSNSEYNYYIAKDNYICSTDYSIQLEIIPIYHIKESVKIYSKVKFGNLEFKCNQDGQTSFDSSSSISKILEADQNFIEEVNRFNRNNKSISFDINTGKFYDVNGNFLNDSNIYYIENGEIHPTSVEEEDYFYVDKQNRTEDGANIVLYSGQNSDKSMFFSYDKIFSAHKDGDTGLDYSGAIVVSDKIIPGLVIK